MIYKYRTGFNDHIRIRGNYLLELIDAPKPILWDNAGMYFLFPIQVIKNAISEYENNKQIAIKNASWFDDEIHLGFRQANYIEPSKLSNVKTIPI